MTYGPPPTHGQPPSQPRNGDGTPPTHMPYGAQTQAGWNPAPPQQHNRGSQQPQEAEESYADPPRTWKRAGSLLGSWAVVWASILIAGLVFEGLVDAAPDTITHEDPGTPHNAAKEYMRFIYVDRSLEDAENNVCDETTGLSSQELLDAREQWETERGVEAQAVVTRADDEETNDGNPNSILIRVELQAGDVFDESYYDVAVEQAGSTFCIADVSENTTVE